MFQWVIDNLNYIFQFLWNDNDQSSSVLDTNSQSISRSEYEAPIKEDVINTSKSDENKDENIPEIIKKYDRNYIFILYASQTGTSLRFAKSLAKFLKKSSLPAVVYDICDFPTSDLSDLRSISNAIVLFLLSTFGNGDPTDSGQLFYQWLCNSPDVSSLKYSVFAFGDRTYEHYCKFGRSVDKLLQKLGGNCILTRHDGDSGGNLDDVFTKWKNELLVTLSSTSLSIPKRTYLSEEMCDFKIKYIATNDPCTVFTGEVFRIGTLSRQKKPFHAKNPFLASVIKNVEVYIESERSCKHIELDISNSALRYEPGDHIGVYPTNNPHLVNWLGLLLAIDLDQVIDFVPVNESVNTKKPFPTPCSIRTAFMHYIDLTSVVTVDLLSDLVEYTSSEADINLLSCLIDPNDSTYYQSWIVTDNRTIIAILEDVTTCRPPIEVLLLGLPRLSCRYYSITSSPLLHPQSVHIIVAVVDWITPSNRKQSGVASTYLASKVPHSTENIESVPIFIRKAGYFHLPEKSVTPIIMIGCGTGVAPFRGFIQHRVALKNSGSNARIGDMVLFFGCRNKEADYLFREEIENYYDKGIITHLFTAFSRDTTKKVYVTDYMRRNGQLIWLYLERGAQIYICGKAKTMFRDVQQTLYQIIHDNGSLDEEKVSNYMKNLSDKGRYCIDIW